MRRRYEVWFLRFQLADRSGAWWFRYLLMNPGRAGGGGCAGNPRGAPVQVWVTWFPRDAAPQSFIQGYPQDVLLLSPRGSSPFYFQIEDNRLSEDAAVGRLEVDGHLVTWDLRYKSTFGATLSNVGWIGFSRTPHSDAGVSGTIHLDDQRFRANPLGHGLQGHNCGYRHRHSWTWTHCFFQNADGSASTFEALLYERPFGWQFRKALLWHRGQLYVFKEFEELSRDRDRLIWVTKCFQPGNGAWVTAFIDGHGPSAHRLPYLKTDCSGTFEVSNNSLARATLYFGRPGQPLEILSTDGGAALEMVGG